MILSVKDSSNQSTITFGDLEPEENFSIEVELPAPSGDEVAFWYLTNEQLKKLKELIDDHLKSKLTDNIENS